MSGMNEVSMRDYFAAQAIPEAVNTKPQSIRNRLRALVGLDYNGPRPKPSDVAEYCYSIADAMLAERAKGGAK